MQERLQEILKRERLTPARFAELVGVQRSSVSHILSGRNKPSLEFLRKTMASLEHISPDWLISGVGPYKRLEIANTSGKNTQKEPPESIEGTIKFPSLINSNKEFGSQNQPPADHASQEKKHDLVKEKVESENHRGNEEGNAFQPNSDSISSNYNKTVVKTILFYDDHTFEVFYPS